MSKNNSTLKLNETSFFPRKVVRINLRLIFYEFTHIDDVIEACQPHRVLTKGFLRFYHVKSTISYSSWSLYRDVESVVQIELSHESAQHFSAKCCTFHIDRSIGMWLRLLCVWCLYLHTRRFIVCVVFVRFFFLARILVSAYKYCHFFFVHRNDCHSQINFFLAPIVNSICFSGFSLLSTRRL